VDFTCCCCCAIHCSGYEPLALSLYLVKRLLCCFATNGLESKIVVHR
jgi:hypothetical protein